MSTPGQNASGAPCLHCQSTHVACGFCYGCGSGDPYNVIHAASMRWQAELDEAWRAEQARRRQEPPRGVFAAMAAEDRPVVTAPRRRVSVRTPHRHSVEPGVVPSAALSAPFSGHVFDALREQQALAMFFEWPMRDALESFA